MFKKLLSILFVLILVFAGKSFSQEVKPIGTVEEMQALQDSHKGKVVLINFWATWCKPCVKEFPELVKLYNNYKEKGFELVFVSVDAAEDVESKVIPFLNKQGVEFVSYYNNFNKPEELINFIDINWEGAIPSTYIYDKEGKLTTHILGSKSYEEFEKEIIKNLN